MLTSQEIEQKIQEFLSKFDFEKAAWDFFKKDKCWELTFYSKMNESFGRQEFILGSPTDLAWEEVENLLIDNKVVPTVWTKEKGIKS